jgi:hypothetical protein
VEGDKVATKRVEVALSRRHRQHEAIDENARSFIFFPFQPLLLEPNAFSAFDEVDSFLVGVSSGHVSLLLSLEQTAKRG